MPPKLYRESLIVSPDTLRNGQAPRGSQNTYRTSWGSSSTNPNRTSWRSSGRWSINDLENYNSPSTGIGDNMPLPRQIVFIAIICTAQFTTQMGFGQGVAVLRQIGEGLDITSPGVLSWIIAGYSLTTGTFILVGGRMGDLFGYKKMFVFGAAWFSLWSLICGFAAWSNRVLFIFARVLQGIGPSIMLPNGLAIFGVSYSPGLKKNMAFAFFGACAPSGGTAGAIFASLWTLIWWPWTFWTFGIALGVLAGLAVLVIPDLPQTPAQRRPIKDKIPDLDIAGGTTGVIALILINFAWNQAPAVGWTQPYVYFTLIIGFVIGILFFVIETYVAKSPLIPFSSLNTQVAFVLGCIACGWGSFGTWYFYLWQFLQTNRAATSLLATAYTCPVVISGACASITTGFLLQKLRAAWIITFSMACFCLGNILVAFAPVHQTYWGQTFVATLVTPWGMDMSFPAATVILSNTIAREHQGMAASLVATIVNYSISMGLGFAGTAEVYTNGGGHTPQQMLKGYRSALYVGIGCAGLGVLLGLTYVVKDYMTSHKLKKRREEILTARKRIIYRHSV